MKEKLTSRKFWLAVAAFLASIGTSIAGLVTDHQMITCFGIGCSVIAAAIYAAMEAYVDGKRQEATEIRVIAYADSPEVVNSIFNDSDDELSIGGSD